MYSYKIDYRKHLCIFTPDNTIAISNKCSIQLMLVKKEMEWLEVPQKFGIPKATLYKTAGSKNKHVLENQNGLIQFQVTRKL